MNSQKATGERLLSDQFNENTSEHLHRYAMAREFSIDKIVLDIASGEGYGSNLLAKIAHRVIGVDIDQETVELAKQKYKGSNLEYKVGNAANIPCENEFFDVVVSFETLEHHDKHTEMMLEIKRVLKSSGLCIISTPDKLIYSDKKNKQNPFHVKELYKDEFKTLLSAHFKNVVILKQLFFCGSMLLPENFTEHSFTNFEGDFNKIDKTKEIEAEYLIALASDTDITLPGRSTFIDKDFALNKMHEFQNSSIRYKLGKFILSPFNFFKSKVPEVK
jgi:2-polyprenyl-3-methyl-5-hydroxy-6-metoxy-1,4-benzoquinol methylase